MGYLLGLLNWVLFPKLVEGKSLETSLFALFTLSVLAIQAGGYIINNILDLNIDTINKPYKVLLKDEKSIEEARKLYKSLNVIGVGSGIWFSMQIALPGYSIIFIGTALLLFYYSKNFKSRFIVGNFLVSLLSLVPIAMLSKIVLNQISLEVKLLLYFVFFVSVIREIVKDCQDVKGDYKYGCKTIPIVLGTSRAIVITRILIAIVTISLVLILYLAENTNYLKLYILILLIVPFIWLFYQLDPTKNQWNFKLYSTVLKLLFFVGMNFVFLI